MDDDKLRKILSLSKNQKLTSSSDMLDYMNVHKEWDDEAMKQFEIRVATKKKALEMEGVAHMSDNDQSDESQDSSNSFESTLLSGSESFSNSPLKENQLSKRKPPQLSLDLSDDRSDYDSVLSSPNAMPLKKRLQWASSISPSSFIKSMSPSSSHSQFEES